MTYQVEMNFEAERAGLAGEGELAVVFGREDSGLTDGELDRCTHLVYLPSADQYPSINLAQAVMLMAYELRMAAIGSAVTERQQGQQIASILNLIFMAPFFLVAVTLAQPNSPDPAFPGQAISFAGPSPWAGPAPGRLEADASWALPERNLDGSGSFAPDAGPAALSYDSTLLQVPAGSAATLSDPAAVSPTFTADLDGLKVTIAPED